MDKIENVNLSELVESTASNLLEEKRKSIAGLVKQMLQSAEQLATDVSMLDKQLAKKKQGLADITAKIAKLKAGDWSVLQEAKKPQSQQPEE